MKNKLELSLMIGLGAMLLYYSLTPHLMQWWSVAFSPLCDGVLTALAEGIVLRSKVWEIVSSLVR